MSYTAKRVILLVMAWGLLMYAGWQVRENLTTPDPAAQAVAAVPTPTPDAQTMLQQAIQSNPQDEPSILQLAKLLYDQQDYASAGTLYLRAVQIDPHNVDILLQLAATQFYQGQVADARTTLVQAEALDSSRPDVHLLLGLALSRSAPPDLAGAQREWQQVLQLAPGTALATQAQDLLNSLTPTPGP